jgi:hypothetical protein
MSAFEVSSKGTERPHRVGAGTPTSGQTPNFRSWHTAVAMSNLIGWETARPLSVGGCIHADIVALHACSQSENHPVSLLSQIDKILSC